MHENIRLLEHVTNRAWPALEILEYDGWTLRFANGYTGRANSINPLDGSTLALEEKIAFCENWYAERHLPANYRLNEAMQPPHLDAVLEQRGYERSKESLVMTADLQSLSHSIDKNFSYEKRVADDWLGDWGRWNDVPALHISTAKEMLINSPAEACYGRVADKALGLAVREGDYVGLFDIVVSPAHRRQGLGLVLVSSLLAWGRQQGAKIGYLQVLGSNHPALGLYGGLGFREHHRYWYRKK